MNPTAAEEPLVWTSKGNLPAAALAFVCEWVDCSDYTMCRPTWRLNGEVVKQECHVLHRKGLSTKALAAPLS